MKCAVVLLLLFVGAMAEFNTTAADICEKMKDQYKCDCDPGMEYISCTSTSASGELVVPYHPNFYVLNIDDSNLQSIDLKNMRDNSKSEILINRNKELRQLKNFPNTTRIIVMNHNPKLVFTLPKLQSKTLEDIESYDNGRVTWSENVFAGLSKLKSVIMLNDSITDQDIKDNLQFHSVNNVYVVLHNSQITSGGLINSKLSKNTKQVTIELVGCQINNLDEENFKEIADNPNIILNLVYNPIECSYKKMAWLLKNKSILRDRFKYILCKNYNQRELWSMSPGDFTDGPITTKVY
jgi:hypothetical protein